MTQQLLMFSLEELPANHFQSPDSEKDWMTLVATSCLPILPLLKDDIHITTANISKIIDASGSNPAMHQGGTGVVQAVSACDVADTLTVGANQMTGFIGDVVAQQVNTMAFPWQSALNPIGKPSDISGTLTKNQTMAVAHCIATILTAANNPSRSPQSFEVTNQVNAVYQSSMVVRRLTPVECERLQGFPDNHTNIPWRKKPTAPDGPRYKALGNSMAVPVMKWIGERIQLVDDLMKKNKN